MPIEGRRPDECFKRFHSHVHRLFERTLVIPPHVRLAWAQRGDSATAVLEFTKGDGVSTSLPLKSNHGGIYLSLLQVLHAVPVERPKRWRLETHEYAYRLVDEPDPRTPAAIRWEYRRDVPTNGWPRHHVQANAQAPLNDVLLDLNRARHPIRLGDNRRAHSFPNPRTRGPTKGERLASHPDRRRGPVLRRVHEQAEVLAPTAYSLLRGFSEWTRVPLAVLAVGACCAQSLAARVPKPRPPT